MKKKSIIIAVISAILLMSVFSFLSLSTFADSDTAAGDTTAVTQVAEEKDDSVSSKALAAAIAVGVVGAAGAVSMAIAIAKSTESMARQPEAASKINSAMMLGLVFIETAIIYALIVAILVIFVL